MLRSCLHIALILLILLNGTGYTCIQVHFYLDREQITILYCINKDKPQLECDGKCELGKRLSEAEKQQENGEEISLEELSLVYAPERSVPIQYTPSELDISKLLIDNRTIHISELYRDFFHPPQS